MKFPVSFFVFVASILTAVLRPLWRIVSISKWEDKCKLSPKNQLESVLPKNELKSVLTGDHFLSIVEFLGKPNEFIVCNKEIQKLCKKRKTEIQKRFVLNKLRGIEAEREFLMDLSTTVRKHKSVPLFFTFDVPKSCVPKFGGETKLEAILSQINGAFFEEDFGDSDHQNEVYLWVRVLHGNSISSEKMCIPSVEMPFPSGLDIFPRTSLTLCTPDSIRGLLPKARKLCFKYSARVFDYCNGCYDTEDFHLKVEKITTSDLLDCIGKKLGK